MFILFDQGGQTGNLLLLGLVLLKQVLPTLPLFLPVAAVITGIPGQFPFGQFPDYLSSPIKKITVMGYYDYGTRVAGQIVLQPLDSSQIQVVGGFV